MNTDSRFWIWDWPLLWRQCKSRYKRTQRLLLEDILPTTEVFNAFTKAKRDQASFYQDMNNNSSVVLHLVSICQVTYVLWISLGERMKTLVTTHMMLFCLPRQYILPWKHICKVMRVFMFQWLLLCEGSLLSYVTFGPLAIKNKTMRLAKEQFWLCMCFMDKYGLWHRCSYGNLKKVSCD